MNPGKPKEQSEEASRAAVDGPEPRARGRPAELSAPLLAGEEADAALCESEQKFRSLFELSRDAILLADRERFLDCNEAAVRMFGYATKAELLGRNPAELLPPMQADGKDSIAFMRARSEAVARSGGQAFECQHLRKDGTVFDAEVSVQPIQLKDRRIVQAMVRDITVRKQAVEAWRTSATEFRALAEAMPQMVWITRPDGWNIYFSQQWMDYTGLTLEESLGHGWNKPFHPEDRQRAWDAWQHATTTIGPYSIECRLRRADGIYRWWLIRGVPRKDAAGNILKCNGVGNS